MTATTSFPRPRSVLLAAAAAVALGSVTLLPAFAQTTDPIREAEIATEPLYSAAAGDRPAMMLALSVEYPTVGAQYTGTNNYDPDYYITKKDGTRLYGYIGYYNHDKCYTYHNGSTEDEKYFEIAAGDEGNATNRKCSGNTFSGNFLNWASSSAIDMLRLALSGGDRVVDTTSKTVLQRAYLPAGTAQVEVTLTKNNQTKTKERGPGCFFNSGQFPGKKLTLTQAVGAVPAIMIEQAREQGSKPNRQLGQDAAIHIANMGNRIYFGLVQGATQNCTDVPQAYTVGTAENVPTVFDAVRYSRQSNSKVALSGLIRAGTAGAPTSRPTQSADSGWMEINQTSEGNTFTYFCKEGNGSCYPGGGKKYIVWYGSVDGGWATAIVGPGDGQNGAFRCTNRDNNDGASPNITGGGYRLSSSSPKTFPTPESEISKRGCWMMEIKEDTPRGDAKYALNSKGYFLARVKVCDQNDVRDYGMCTEYPNNGTPVKKPTGVIQKYADDLRLAAFGYVMDPTTAHAGFTWDGTDEFDDFKGRFGGVLRAPMKYVGENAYTPTGVKSANARAEWDANTGILLANPDKCGETGGDTHCKGIENGSKEFKRSGVINYLNQFGRTNPDIQGNYKQYDNLSELYYEAMRYMQGLTPSPADATNGVSAAAGNLDIYANDYMRDGFPVYDDWSEIDPYGGTGYSATGDYTCVPASMVVIGDVNTHDTDRNNSTNNIRKLRSTMKAAEGATDGWSSALNTPDAHYWRDVVRAFEQQHTPGFNTGAGYAQLRHWSTIAGLAYWAHTHDIRAEGEWTSAKTVAGSKVRPGLRLNTYTFDVNEEDKEREYTKRIGTSCYQTGNDGCHWGNQLWLAAKYGGFKTEKTGCTTVEHANGSKTETCTGLYNTSNPFYGMTCTTTITKDADGNEQRGEEVCENSTTASDAIWSDLSKAQGNNTDGATNPEPRNYYMMENGRGVLEAFDAIFGDQKRPANRSIAGADAAGGLGGKGTSFQAEFDGTTWSGDVIAETIVVGSGQKNERRASSALPNHADRNIIMGERGSDGSTSAFAFTAANAGRLPELDGGDATAADRINWLRGDRSKEGDTLRVREGTLLGDIVNSGVKYVGAPAGSVNLGLGYADFVGDALATEPERVGASRRAAAIYVGANDGMLHAFHAGGKELDTSTTPNTVKDLDPTLVELFAYIPSWMKGKLAALTDPAYGSASKKHQLYVDATPVIGDANLKGDCTATTTGNVTTNDCKWRSVLVGGTGGGGRGVYALDVTDPAAFDASKVLWEFTDEDDPDMGYVLGQARIVKLLYTAANTAAGTPAVYRWFAMVPAGVNNYVGDDTTRVGNGHANIFLLALDKPSNVGWGAANTGGYYWKLELPRDQSIQGTHPTGVLNLEAFTGVGGVTEYVYAGDLHGQLWALKFKDNGSSGWDTATLANCYSSGTCGEGAIKPLFIARTPADGNGNTKPQPITVAPTILEGAGNGVHFVSFGTGKYFEESDGDADKIKVETFYTVYSNFNHTAADILSRDTGAAIIPNRGYLQEVVFSQTKTEGGVSVDYFKPNNAFFWGWLASQPAANETGGVRSGWYMDFVEHEGDTTRTVGERQIADASWIGLTSRLMFSTLTPNSATSTDVCGTGGGASKLYTFDMISGKGIGRLSSVGMLAQPLVFLDTANAEETEADSTGRRLRITPVMSGQFGSGGSNVEKVDTVIVPFGRLSWRRIDNFEGLRQSGGTSNPSAGGAGGNPAGGSDD